MRTLLLLSLVAACGGGGPTHWKDQPVETVSGTFKGHAYSIDLAKGMTKSSADYSDEYQYHQDRNGEPYTFAPSVSVSWSEKKRTLDDELKTEKDEVVHKESTADGWIAAIANGSKKDDYVIHAERFVGESAFRCNARVYAMKKGEDVKALIPLVEKMCLSIKAK